MNNMLLPPSSTPLERAVVTACAPMSDLPVPIRDLISAEKCPLPFLPYLAWARSVDRWDVNWSVQVKRAVIRAAWQVHKHKGTISAIRRAVEPLGYLIEVIEWWQTLPRGTRGTFALKVGVLNTGITDQMYQELERLIDDAKPLSRHLTGLAISLEARGTANIGVIAYLGDELTVYPFSPTAIVITGMNNYSGSHHLIDTMSIYP